MKAIVIHKTGGYSNLKIEDSKSPEISNPSEVLVSVWAVGVNYADCAIRLGLYKSAKEHKEYKGIPGFDFAGTVEKAGSEVAGFKIGDRVFGVTLFGAYASEVVVEQKYLFLIPENISFQTASSLPTAFLTAHHILHALAHIQKGESALVHSIAGGVGSWLALLAARAGVEVYGDVSSEEKKKTMMEQGIKNVAVRDGNEWSGKKFDVIANAHGGRLIKKDIMRLNPSGRLVVYGFHSMIQTTERGRLSIFSWGKLAWEYFRMPRINPFTLVNENKSVLGCNLSYLFGNTGAYRAAMNELISILKEGTVLLPPITEIPFEEVAQAHYRLEHRKTIGKLVLVLTEN